MSMTATSVVNDAQDIKARSAAATRTICEALHLGVVAPKNLQYLTVALTETVTKEIAHNPALGEQIRTLYEELVPASKTKSIPRKSTAAQSEDTRPRNRGSMKPSPNDPLDFEYLARNFSREQVLDELKKYNMDELKAAVTSVQQQHPGTRPVSFRNKDAVVTYLLEYAL